jgi:cytochrome oxidase Cu insertion factor (SCO1/SenC/PrrC family)
VAEKTFVRFVTTSSHVVMAVTANNRVSFRLHRMRKIIALLVSVLVLAGCANLDSSDHTHHSQTIDESNFSEATPAADGGTFLKSQVSSEVKSIELLDSDGNTFSLDDLSGQIIILANFYTSCSHVCPMTTANMKQMAEQISNTGSSEKITVLEVSVDGDRDTVGRINDYQKLYGDKSWIMATANQKALNRFWKFFGVIPEAEPITEAEQQSEPKDWLTGKANTYRMVDAPIVNVIDPDLNWRWLNTGLPDASKDYVPTTLMNYLSEHGLDTLQNPGEGAWTIKSVFSAIKEIAGYEIG